MPAHDDVATVLQFLKSRGYEETSVVVEGVLVATGPFAAWITSTAGALWRKRGMVVSDDGKTGLVMVGEKLDQATKLDPFKDGQRIRFGAPGSPTRKAWPFTSMRSRLFQGSRFLVRSPDALDLMHLAEQLKKSLPAGGDLTMYGPSRLKGGIGNWEPAPEYPPSLCSGQRRRTRSAKPNP